MSGRHAGVPFQSQTMVNPSLLVIYAARLFGCDFGGCTPALGPTLPNSGDDESSRPIIPLVQPPATCGIERPHHHRRTVDSGAMNWLRRHLLADNDREGEGILLELINKIPDIGTVLNLYFLPRRFVTPHEQRRSKEHSL